MRFERRSETLNISGQDVVVYELTAGEFEGVHAIEDGSKQMLELIRLSLNGVATADDIMSWPNSILTQISDAVLVINGLKDQPGN